MNKLKGLVTEAVESMICNNCRSWTDHKTIKYQAPSKKGKFYPFVTQKATCLKCNFEAKCYPSIKI